MKFEQPMANRLAEFVTELEAKQQHLVETIQVYNDNCAQEQIHLSERLRLVKSRLIIAETARNDATIKQIEEEISQIEREKTEVEGKSKRYEGIDSDKLLFEDFPKLKKYAIASRKERAQILSDIDNQISENKAKIANLQNEIYLLAAERSDISLDSEAKYIARISAYLPGGDQLNPYSPGRYDPTLIQQIDSLLFE